MNDNIKLVDLPTEASENLKKMKQEVRNLNEMLEDIIEYNNSLAKIIRAKYDAFIKEGFAPEQALILCKGII